MSCNYSKEELAGLQKCSLDMAKYFVDFCNKHNLICYFCGGGCIGALRHKGFIPWDDDLDFFMPRKDYEKMMVLWKQENANSRYKLSRSKEDYVDRNLFVTIRDTQTTIVKPYQADLDIPHGVALDVLPLDGYAPTPLKRKMQCVYALIYSLFCAQTIPEKHGKLMTFGSKLLLGLFHSPKLRYRIWSWAEKQMTKYDIADCESITELCSGPGYMKNEYPKHAFEKAVFVPFEDTMMPIPIGYDEYLKIAFGDYMQMPPEGKRVAHHEALFLDLENGYEKYRGIQFLVNQKVGK